jgi:two-component system sensor kinase FixL
MNRDSQSLLRSEMRWFVRLRWLAGAAVILGAVADAFWEGWSDEHPKMLAIGGAILVYNLAIWSAFRLRRGGMDRGFLYSLAWSQITLDLACLTLLCLLTGGISSPLLGLFVLHMIFASLLLPRLTSYITATAAMAAVVAGLWLTDQWPHDRLAVLITLGWMLTLLLTVYLANHITRGLRRRENELHEQSRRTQAILETAADGIITIDEQGTIRSINPAAEHMFGYRGPEIIGRNVSVLMPEPQRSEHDTYIADHLHTGQAKIIGIGREVAGRRKDGEIFPMRISVSEVFLGQERIFTGILRDITRQKQAESELKALNEALKRQQAALIHQEKMTAMGKMAAGVAHEIANPLASMDSLLQLMRRQPDRLRPDTAQTLREQVDRINRIVQQMTAFAHPNETEWAWMPLNTVVEGALEMVRFDRRMRDVKVVRDLSQQEGTIYLMPQAIQQVLVNLIFNALDALADVPEPRLAITTRRQDNWWVVDVKDNGTGIAPEHLTRVFEPFFTTKPVGQGTGLGLSISYNLIKRHDGDCEVHSAAGRGATFSVRLPVSGPSSGPREGMGNPAHRSENAQSESRSRS